jgi:uncharacterized protein
VLVELWVQPGAKRSQVSGVADGRVRLRLAAPAREGRANAELIRFLAATLDVRRARVTIEAGEGSRRKVVRVTALDQKEVAARLGV